MSEQLTNFLNSDDAIFHYTKKENAMERILNEKQLKFGLYRETNDPYEYKLRDIILTIWSPTHEPLVHKSMALFTTTIHNTPFLSFCDNSTGYKKPRMWSQYGQDHKGICLVFSKESLMTTIKNELSKNYFIYDENINYKEIDCEPLKIDNNDLAANEIVMNHIKKDYKNIFFQKHLDYKDENEFRIVLIQKDTNPSSQSLLVDISNSLKLIILGDKFPKEDLPTIKDLSTKLNIGFKELSWEHNQYFLFDKE